MQITILDFNKSNSTPFTFNNDHLTTHMQYGERALVGKI